MPRLLVTARSYAVAAVLGAALLGLGADLTRTAFLAAHTAQRVIAG